jgi:hypothetical protein
MNYDTNILPKFVFDKKEFIKFKISNNFKQNIDETNSKLLGTDCDQDRIT